MKLMFWKTAKAYNIANNNEVIEELDKFNHVAIVGFKGNNPKVFCRAFMKTRIARNGVCVAYLVAM